jgi:hypothetical protein
MPDEAPESWRTIRYGSRVLAADGSTIGSVAEVLGSDPEDIFHGIRMDVPGGKAERVVPADRVTGIDADAVSTSLAPDDVPTLETYDDVATYHLASVGWLRRTLGWKRDSNSDEEPGDGGR